MQLGHFFPTKRGDRGTFSLFDGKTCLSFDPINPLFSSAINIEGTLKIREKKGHTFITRLLRNMKLVHIVYGDRKFKKLREWKHVFVWEHNVRVVGLVFAKIFC